MPNESMNEGTRGARSLNPALTQPLDLECGFRLLFLQCLGFRICEVRLSPNKPCSPTSQALQSLWKDPRDREHTSSWEATGGGGVGVCVCVCVYALFEMAPLGDSALSLQWSKSLGGENLEFQELRDVCLPGICLPRFPGMKMRYTPFSAFSGFPGRQPCGPADSSGPAHSGRAVGLGLGRAVGLGLAQGLGLTSSFLPGSLLLPPHCTGLIASRSQEGSLALGFWAQAVVGRPRQWEARGQVFPAAPTPFSFSLSPCPPLDGDPGSLPEIKGCHPVPCGEEERGETLSLPPR